MKLDIPALSENEIWELARRGEHLAPPDGLSPRFDDEAQATHYRDRTLGLTARGVASFSARMANGGVPSKRAGKTYKVFGMEIHSEVAAMIFWRGVFGAILMLILLRQGNTVTVGADGMTVAPKVATNGGMTTHEITQKENRP